MKKAATILVIVVLSIPGLCQWSAITTHYQHYWIDEKSDVENIYDAIPDMTTDLLAEKDLTKRKHNYRKEEAKELLMEWGIVEQEEGQWYVVGIAYSKDTFLLGNEYNIKITKGHGGDDTGLITIYGGEITRAIQQKYNSSNELVEVVESLPGGKLGDVVKIEEYAKTAYVALEYKENGIVHIYTFYDPGRSWFLESEKTGKYIYEFGSGF